MTIEIFLYRALIVKHPIFYPVIKTGLRIRNDLFRIWIFYFWIPDPAPDPTRVFKLKKIFELKFQSSLSEKFLFKIVELIFGYHVGDCVTTSKDDKLCLKKNKNLIRIFSNKRC